jgi:hypothetical protein
MGRMKSLKNVFIKLRCNGVSVYRLAKVTQTTEDLTVVLRNFIFFPGRPKLRI